MKLPQYELDWLKAKWLTWRDICQICPHISQKLKNEYSAVVWSGSVPNILCGTSRYGDTSWKDACLGGTVTR